MKELTVAATVENIEKVTDFVNEQLESIDCPLKVQTQIDIAIDELFGNIAKYAYAEKTGTATVVFQYLQDKKAVRIVFSDSGKPYDPLSGADPDTTLPAEDRPIGGLGIYMVKKSMDDLSYQYKDGQNILTIQKRL